MPSDRPRQLWLLPVLLLTVILTAVGGLVARTLYEEPVSSAAEAVLPSTTSLPASEQPGDGEVKGTADATAHPLYRAVQELLQRYFDAINARDYGMWRETVTDERAERQPEEKWLVDYQSTRDGSIVIYRIELSEGDTLRALIAFTSTQDRADAPPELPVECIHWNVVFPLALEPGGWKLDAGPASAAPQYEACA